MKRLLLLLALAALCVPVHARDFSFTYNGLPSSTVISGWNKTTNRAVNGTKTTVTTRYTQSLTGIQLTHAVTTYSDFPGTEYSTMKIKNTGTGRSSIFADVMPLSQRFTLPANGDMILDYANGSHESIYDFMPQYKTLDSQTFTLESFGGRSSDGVMPFMRVRKPDGSGVAIAVGWSGHWKGSITKASATELDLSFGQGSTNFLLYADEEVICPSMLTMEITPERAAELNNATASDDSEFLIQNEMRAFLLKYFTPKDENGVNRTPPLCCADAIDFATQNAARHINNIEKLNSYNIDYDYYFIDTGWYEGAGTNWAAYVGNYSFDQNRYPNGVRPISDAAASHGKGFLLWFEPERVMPNTEVYNEHYNWIITPPARNKIPSGYQYMFDSQFCLFNLGNDEAREWMRNMIGNMITEGGIDIFRTDFNMYPQWYWEKQDGSTRIGITEMKYIAGLYAFWDGLLADHPGLMIDNCASGGRRIDLETISRSFALWRSDNCWVASATQCHNWGLNRWIPLTGNGAAVCTVYDSRSGYGPHYNYALDWNYATDGQMSIVKSTFNELRATQKYYGGDYFPLTGYSQDSNVWMAWQFHLRNEGEGMVMAFRREDNTEESKLLKLHGLNPDSYYEITCVDDASAHRIYTGAQLSEIGVRFKLDQKDSSYITYKETTIGDFDVPLEEYTALVDLYNATDGDNWTKNDNWLSATVGNWYGVTVQNGHVTKIAMTANNLVGYVPDSFTNLTGLMVVTLNKNNITSVPADFSALTSLRTFNMGGNALTSVPTGVAATSPSYGYNAVPTALLEAAGCGSQFITQTVAPANLKAGVSGDTISATWTKIRYTSGGGGYELGVLKDGNCEYGSATSNKTIQSATLNHYVDAATALVVRTKTNANTANPYIIYSDPSAPLLPLTGKVKDANTGVPARGVTVTIDDVTSTTDRTGTYYIYLPDGTYTASVSGANCAPVTEEVTVSGATVHDFLTEVTSATYYVDDANGSDDNDGSADHPFKTISAADRKGILTPGDTVIVRAGTYDINAEGRNCPEHIVNCYGTEEAPITYLADGAVYVRNVSDPGDRSRHSACAMAVGTDYIIFDGFDFSGGTVCFKVDNAVGVVARNCKMHDTDYTTAIFPSGAGIYIEGGPEACAIIENCEIYNIGNEFTDNYPCGYYNMVGYWYESYTPSTLRNCYIHDIRGMGFFARGGDSMEKCYNNTFVNCSTAVTTHPGDKVGGSADVRNNIICDCGTGMANPGKSLVNSNNIIYNTGTPFTAGAVQGDNTYYDNPLFTAAPVISDESPAVNKGVDVGLPYFGTAPDIGCYETDVASTVFATVRGTVTENGEAASGVTVRVGDLEAVTGTDGTYSLTVRRGTYHVSVDISDNRDVSDPYDITLVGGDEAVCDFTLTYNPKTYYVSTTGNDSKDGLTPATAWKNINRGDRTQSLYPGDTVIVLPGTYTGDTKEMTGYYEPRYGYRLIQCAGREGKPITYKAQGNVTIINTLCDAAASVSKCISICTEWIVLDGFKLTGACCGVGIDYYGSNSVIQNCEFYDFTPTDIIWPQSAGVYIDPTNTSGEHATIEVRNNVFRDMPNLGGWSYAVYNMLGYWESAANISVNAHHNLIMNIAGAGICSRGGDTHDTFYNNTVINCPQGVAVCQGTNVGGSCDAKNNIFVGNTNCVVGAETSCTVTNDNNLVWNTDNNTCNGNFIYADPLLGDDYYPTEGSPAIDAGLDLGFAFIGAAPDMGAYEYEPTNYIEVGSIDEIDGAETGSYVEMTFDLTAAVVFPDNTVYACRSDRLQGVKFTNLTGVVPGDRLKVKGKVRSDGDGKYVEVRQVVSKTAGDAPKALALTNTSLDTNVLVRVWGTVVSKSPGTLVIKNGETTINLLTYTDVAVGDFVYATGAATKSGVRVTEIL